MAGDWCSLYVLIVPLVAPAHLSNIHQICLRSLLLYVRISRLRSSLLLIVVRKYTYVDCVSSLPEPFWFRSRARREVSLVAPSAATAQLRNPSFRPAGQAGGFVFCPFTRREFSIRARSLRDMVPSVCSYCDGRHSTAVCPMARLWERTIGNTLALATTEASDVAAQPVTVPAYVQVEPYCELCHKSGQAHFLSRKHMRKVAFNESNEKVYEDDPWIHAREYEGFGTEKFPYCTLCAAWADEVPIASKYHRKRSSADQGHPLPNYGDEAYYPHGKQDILDSSTFITLRDWDAGGTYMAIL